MCLTNGKLKYSSAYFILLTLATSQLIEIKCFVFCKFSDMPVLYLPVKGGLQPSRRRSLFTLASYMLIFSARAGNFPELIQKVKTSLTETTVSFFPESLILIPIPCLCYSACFLKLNFYYLLVFFNNDQLN